MMLQQVQSSKNAIPSKATASNQSGNSGSSSATKTNLDYDDFLKLLVMQLRYQDPLSPLENSEFIAQNAQFSTVEQLIAIKESLANQAKTADVANASYATNMIGKEIVADAGYYEDNGEYTEAIVTGIVREVTFLRSEGEILLKLDNDVSVNLSQVLSVREP